MPAGDTRGVGSIPESVYHSKKKKIIKENQNCILQKQMEAIQVSVYWRSSISFCINAEETIVELCTKCSWETCKLFLE